MPRSHALGKQHLEEADGREYYWNMPPMVGEEKLD